MCVYILVCFLYIYEDILISVYTHIHMCVSIDKERKIFQLLIINPLDPFLS